MEELKVKSLGKALDILNLFAEAPCEYGVSDLARRMDLPKSSVHNIVSTFSHYGILQYNERTRMYQLGYKVLELGNVFQKKDVFVTVMQPFMKMVSEKTRECVYLAKPSGTRVIYLDALFPENSTAGMVVGVTAPMYCTGIGKAMLAKCDNAILEKVLAEPKKSYTSTTITDSVALEREIAEIRRCGFSVDNMEHEFGIKCVAVPILDANSALVGGISVSGPSLRFSAETIQEYASMLCGIAERVRRYL